MWQPEKIRIKNLLTHENTEYIFKKNRSTMIFGVNLTDKGADSNGSGKSGLAEGITLALSGKTCRDVGKEDFIRDDSDECFVQFDLSNNLGDVKDLSIRRWIHRKKSAKLEIWENGEQNKELTSVNEANQRIFDLIGITREDLLHFFVIGQNTNHSFLTSGDSEQKSIISRLTNAEIIDQKIEVLVQKRKVSEELISSEMSILNKVEASIELIAEEMEELKEANKIQNSDKEKPLRDSIKSINKDNEKLQESLDSEHISLNKKKTQLSKKKTQLPNVEDVKKKMDSNKKKIRELKSNVDEAEDLVSDLERILKGTTTCPNCEHEWHQSEDIDIDEIPVLIEQSNAIVEQSNKDIKKLQKINDKLQLEIDDFDSKNKELRELSSEISDLEDEIKSTERKIKRNKSEISDLEDEIKSLSKDSPNKKRMVELKEKLSKSNENKKVLDSKISKMNEELNSHNFWISHLGKKGFTTYLANHSIKTIEGVTNSFLKKFNTDLKINIDGYTVLKSGDVREKISISVVRNGRSVGTFNRYSGGERGRIDIACVVGLQKLMNMSAKNGGLNLLVLDEVFEGLDVTGQKDVLNILDSTGVTTLVVSHRSDSIGAENEIYVVKENNVSVVLKEWKEGHQKLNRKRLMTN